MESDQISEFLMPASCRTEIYTIGYSDKLRKLMSRRTAADCAGFFLPHLHSGMTVLDCGCGPGSITVDFAQLLAPGFAVGVDSQVAQVEAAKALAADRAVGNAYFYTANTYDLPFGDASFDAVFAHSLLVHLREPLRAIEEMRRVLKPDGVLAIVDSDYGARIWSPSTPLFDQFQKLFLRVLEHNGASLYYARHQRALLRKAGFTQTVGYTSSVGFGTVEATRISAAAWEECAHTRAFVETVLAQGWADETMLAAMFTELRNWAERPDAFNALLTCAAIGWGR